MIELPFSNPLWIPTISITILVGCIIIAIGKMLPKKDHKIMLAQAIGVLLFVRLIFTHAYEFGRGDWSAHVHLPIHLCGISSILCIFIMFRYNQKIFNFLALLGIPSALHSLLTPQWANPYNDSITGELTYRFYEFYISHGAILFVPIFLIIVFSHKITLKSWKSVFIQLSVICFFVGLANAFLRFISYGGLYVGKDIGSNGEKLANYLYLCKAPVIDNPLIFTREWPVYMPIILFIGLLHILILYYFFNALNKVSND